MCGLSEELQDNHGNWIDDRVMLLPKSYATVTGKDMRKIETDALFVFSYKMWVQFKDYGLPHGCGYINERPIVITCIDLWEQASRFAQNWEFEKRKR